MNIEKAFEIVGTCGKYQLFLLFMMFISNFCIATQMVIMVIVGATPNTEQADERALHTIVTEFDLYDKKWIVELMQSLFMAGFMIGCTTFGQISDIYGRRFTLIPCLALSGACSLFSGLANSWQVFAVTRFFAGVFIGGVITGFTLMLELIGPNAWQWAGMVFQTFFSLGMMFLAGLGYWVMEWRTICWILGGFLFVIFVVFLLIYPESPRWLYSVGRIEEAQVIMRNLASGNGKDPSEIILTRSNSGSETVERKSTFIDIFRHRKLTIWLITNATVWFCSALIYYGLTMSVGDLTPSIYLGVLLSGAVEIPGGLVCIYFLGTRRLGRKGTIMMTFVICLITLIGMAAQPDGSRSWRLGFGLTAKLAIAAAFNILYIYSSEIFPTPLRSVGLGVSSTIGRIGAIIAPFVTLLLRGTGFTYQKYSLVQSTVNPSIPYVVFTATCCLSILSIMFLPRTFGYMVPQNIDEALNRRKADQHIDGNDETPLLGNADHEP